MLHDDPLPWLLEDDPNNPGVRCYTVCDLLNVPEDAPEVRRAQAG
jgi:hypothetical protein